MNRVGIVGTLGILVAVVGAFVSIPYAALILLALGLVGGIGQEPDLNVRVIVSAIALKMLAPAFDAVPAIGSYLTSVTTNVGALLAGVALCVIFTNVYKRTVGSLIK